tara:strand:+ start:32719 stop:33051 length:333 start_codon:yes stop_codon:yes gene_type:complete
MILGIAWARRVYERARRLLFLSFIASGNNFLHFLVVTKFFGVDAAAASEGRNNGRVAIDIHLRHLGFNDLEVSIGFHSHDLPPTPGDITHYITEIVFWDCHLDIVDRFQE